MPVYEKTTKELMHDFAKQVLTPGRVFSKQDAVAWFRVNYPKLKDTTVAMHVDGMSVNSRLRRFHATIKPNADWDLFFKLAPREFRLWDPAHDPAPIYKPDIDAKLEGEISDPESSDDDETEAATGESTFAFERDLQNYLVRNLGLLESGLTLYVDEDNQFTGREFPVGQRSIDILAIGRDEAYVVIETKVSRAYDKVVGQLLRYMGWINQNMAGDRPVRGIIVASEISDDLKLAASQVHDVRLVEYEISFSLKLV